MTSAAEYLARVGFGAILADPTPPDDEDDPRSIEQARIADHDRVRRALLTDARPMTYARAGVEWLRPITWPDRVPGLVTWSGQQTLVKVITKLQKPLRTAEMVGDLYEYAVPMRGASGIDSLSAPDSIDVGFSINAIGMAIVCRPAIELLAIYGLECVPIVSFSARECGFFHAGKTWRFRVEPRDGGYYHRWGDLEIACESPAALSRVGRGAFATAP